MGFRSQEAAKSLSFLFRSVGTSLTISLLPYFGLRAALFFLLEARLPEEGEGKGETTQGTKRKIHQSAFQKQLSHYTIMTETFPLLVAEGEVSKPGREQGALPLSGMLCVFLFAPWKAPWAARPGDQAPTAILTTRV